jgi:hypothetical protein
MSGLLRDVTPEDLGRFWRNAGACMVVDGVRASATQPRPRHRHSLHTGDPIDSEQFPVV